MKVHNGFKVFNFSRQSVTKVFDDFSEPERIVDEVEIATRIGEFSFAPAVRLVNFDGRWYEEDFLDGYSASRASLVEALVEIAAVSDPVEIDSKQYLSERRSTLHGPTSQLSDDTLDAGAVDAIRKFVDVTIDNLAASGWPALYLVFSHGDFSARHVFETANGLKIVDWEAAANRSALYDLHDAFFQPYVNNQDRPKIQTELATAIQEFRHSIALNKREALASMFNSLAAVDAYRLAYYVESITWFVEPSKRITKRGLAKLVRMTDAFQQYESELLTTREASLPLFGP